MPIDYRSWDYDTRAVTGRILNQYGVMTDASAKNKALLKFGRTANADSGVWTTVGTLQGVVVNETFATTNSVDSIVSDSTNDTSAVTVEGHYLDGTDFVFAAETVTLTGQTAVPLSRGYARINRIYVTLGTVASPAVALVGNVYAYDATAATGTTSGVPDVATATKCMIVAGSNQSEKCATSISSADYWVVTSVSAAVQKGNASTVTVDVDVEYRTLGGVWLPLGLELSLRTAGTSTITIPVDPPAIIPSNTDVRMVALSNTNDTTVSGNINGYLTIVV